MNIIVSSSIIEVGSEIMVFGAEIKTDICAGIQYKYRYNFERRQKLNVCWKSLRLV